MIDRRALWIAAGLAMGPVVALGLGRFAYALLLPGMRLDLDWSYADAGLMNTANALGYLAGAWFAADIARATGSRLAYMGGIILTALALLASGLTSSFGILLFLRFAAGAFGALAYVVGAALSVAAVRSADRSGVALSVGIFLSGSGIGIFVSALAVPPLLAQYGWRGGWIILGLVSLVACLLSWAAVRRTSPLPETPRGSRRDGGSLRFLAPSLAAYAFFGAGYIAYMTFIIAYFKEEGFGAAQISIFWALLGAAALVGPTLWSPLFARVKGGGGMVAALASVTVGAVLPLVFSGNVAMMLSGIVFGSSFLGVVAAVTTFAGKATEPHALTAVMGILTVAFGLGQSIGPILSGAISDGPHGVGTGLLASAGILLAGAVLASRQREPRQHG